MGRALVLILAFARGAAAMTVEVGPAPAESEKLSAYERIARRKRPKAEPPPVEERKGEPMVDLDDHPMLEPIDSFAHYAIAEKRGEKRGLRTDRLVEIGPVELERREAEAKRAAELAARREAERQQAARVQAMGTEERWWHEVRQAVPDWRKNTNILGLRELAKKGNKIALMYLGHFETNGAKAEYDGRTWVLKGGGKGQKHYWEAGEERVTASPLVFDLNGDGVRMSRRRYRNADVDGDRRREPVNEISLKDGLLVLDIDRDGAFGEGGQELLGTATDLDGDGRPDGFADGFEALRALARRAEARRLLPEGTADRGELGFTALAALEAAFGLRMKVGGINRPAVPLERAGVVSITLPSGACERVKDFDGQGNETLRCAGAAFRRTDGTTGAYEDVFFEL